jgi:hypothetical protein
MRKLGKLPKRVDRRTLKLASYLQPARLTLPPRELDWGRDRYPMFRNDEIGCCTIAAAAHMVEDWSAMCHTGYKLTDHDVIKAYSAVTGYDPDTGANDNGAVMLDVLNYWRQTGIGGHKILAYAEADTTNIVECQLAHWLFGGLYLGLALPASAEQQQVWDIPDGGPVNAGEPYSWGGHAVRMCAYDTGWDTVATWGQRQKCTWQWLLTYADEAYAVLSDDWLSRAGVAPNGFNVEKLRADLALVQTLSRNR